MYKRRQEQESTGKKNKTNSKPVTNPNKKFVDEEGMCQGCTNSYDDDKDDIKELSVERDNDCSRWYHYTCAILKEMPEQQEPFISVVCKSR